MSIRRKEVKRWRIILIVFILLVLIIVLFNLGELKGKEKVRLEKTNKEILENIVQERNEDQIKVIIGEKEFPLFLENSQTISDFLQMLPLTLTLEDYHRTEKIAYLPNKLTVIDSPSGYDPKIGDLCYYAPWGNICFFYQDFGYSNGLIKLGTLESGIEELAKEEGEFSIRIEK